MHLKPGITLISETEGTGPGITSGDRVTIRLNGWLNQGDQFQTDHICDVRLGARSVIAGLEYSLEGMRLGGRRKVKISAHLAYRDEGVPGMIPANAVLVYEIEVLRVQPAC